MEPSRVGRTRALTIASVGGLTAMLSGCVYAQNVGLDIDPTEATCFMQDSTAVLQLPVAADPSVSFDPDVLRVEFDDPSNMTLAGIGVVDDTNPFDQRVPDSVLESLQASRDDTMLHAEIVHGEARTIVVLLRTTDAEAPGRVESLRVFWGGREPVYWQPLDLAITLDDACVIAVE